MAGNRRDQVPVLTDENGDQVTSIKQDCEILWQEILGLQEKAEGEGRALTDLGNNSLEAIYSVKEQRLRAEIESMQNYKPNLLPKDKVTLKTLVKEMLTENVRQLEEVLASVKMERAELESEIKIEKELLAKQEQINASLQSKLELIGQEPVDRNKEIVLKEITQKCKHVVKYNKHLQKKMVLFVDEQFPGPEEKETEKFRKKERQKPGIRETGDYGSPIVLLEDLMNHCLETPHDPYVTINPSHFPPFVELLLSTGIAQRHPQDDQKLRLTPYHL